LHKKRLNPDQTGKKERKPKSFTSRRHNFILYYIMKDIESWNAFSDSSFYTFLPLEIYSICGKR